MNKVIIMGRLGKDPEVRHFNGGGIASYVSVATDESYKDREGNKVSVTEWHNVVFRGKTAEIVEKYLRKGDQLLVEGKIRTRSWDDKDGSKRYTTEVVADRFEFAGTRTTESGTQNAKPAATPEPQGWDSDLPF